MRSSGDTTMHTLTPRKPKVLPRARLKPWEAMSLAWPHSALVCSAHILLSSAVGCPQAASRQHCLIYNSCHSLLMMSTTRRLPDGVATKF